MHQMHFRNKEFLIHPMFTWKVKVKFGENIQLLYVSRGNGHTTRRLNFNCMACIGHGGARKGRVRQLGEVRVVDRNRFVIQVNRALVTPSGACRVVLPVKIGPIKWPQQTCVSVRCTARSRRVAQCCILETVCEDQQEAPNGTK
jgi:hypothetical protein